jgi:D-2-hydroxyacid dehydrogenase (NADP+)
MPTILMVWRAHPITAEQLEQVHAAAPGYRVVVARERAEMEALLEEIEIVAGRAPPDVLARAPRLRWYQQWDAGVDWLLNHPELSARDFWLTNSSGIHAIPLAEHVLGLMLALTRRLPQAMRAQSRHEWYTVPFGDTTELYGKTVVIVGMGPIGQRAAQVAAALGMRVLGVRSHADRMVPGVEKMVGPDGLCDALCEADFLVLAAPLTGRTRGMIGRRELASIKSGAFLINVGRGATLDEAALIDVLRQGRLAGAGLDVFEAEPLPTDSPLWDMQNVLITAHYAGDSPHYHERAMVIFLDNLRRYIAGDPLCNLVDKQRGY